MIFLSILKIIGIVLLCILAVVILFVLAVLFVPIQYRVSGEKYDELHCKGRASWLLGAISFRFSYDLENKLKYKGCVFGIKVFPKKKKHQKKSTKINATKKEKPEATASTENEATAKRRKFRKLSFIEWLKKVKDYFVSKFKKLKRSFKKWKRIITDDHNKNAIRLIKEKLFLILKVIKPKKMFLKADFSIGSPDRTALALGVVSMFPVGYQNHWKIHPDFDSEELYFRGEGFAKGHIYVYKVLFAALSVIFDKECKRLYRMINK